MPNPALSFQDDDPNAVISNIISEIRSLGLTTDFPPSRLKSGCGDEVRFVYLSQLAERYVFVINIFIKKRVTKI